MAEIVVGNVVTIASILVQINDVAKKVRRNKDDCIEIAEAVARNSSIFELLEELTNKTQDERMSKIMEDLKEDLKKALTLVTECQKKNLISHFFRAGDMAMDLNRVQTNLGQSLMRASVLAGIHDKLAAAPQVREQNEAQPKHPNLNVTSDIMQDTLKNLIAAISLVKKCQNKNFIYRFFRGGHIATELSRLQANLEENIKHTSRATIHGTIKLQRLASAAPKARSMLSNWNEVNEQEEETMTSMGCDDSLTYPSGNNIGFRRFSLSELKEATHDFSDVIGEGGFGTVYKGVLRNGSLVAIKKLHSYGILNDPLREEFNILARVQHKNVLKLVGYSIDVKLEFLRINEQYVEVEARQQYLVLGYVPNGSLEMIIDGTTRIDWSSCFRIIQEVVQGVHYLHQQRVVHMDMQPSNIRFDLDMNPVIVYFGLSIVLAQNEDEVTLDHNVGTMGYMPPEQFDKGTASMKSDVYTFGVTLRKTITSVCTGSQEHWHTMLRDAGGIVGSHDEALQVDESQLMEIKRCEVVALLCTEYDPRDRPTMEDVLQMLTGEKELPTPKIPFP